MTDDRSDFREARLARAQGIEFPADGVERTAYLEGDETPGIPEAATVDDYVRATARAVGVDPEAAVAYRHATTRGHLIGTGGDAPIDDGMVEAAARELHEQQWPGAPWNDLTEESRRFIRSRARAISDAALPHLQPSEAETIVVHHHDIEKHAEHFNEGYDEANRQGIGGEGSRGWLIEKVGEILEPHFADWDDVADQIADALLSEADLGEAETKALTSREPEGEALGAIQKWYADMHDDDGFNYSTGQHDLPGDGSELKALAETATELGRRLGRKEAGEEIADAVLGQRLDAPGVPHDRTRGWNEALKFAAETSRSIASQGQPAATSARTDASRHPTGIHPLQSDCSDACWNTKDHA